MPRALALAAVVVVGCNAQSFDPPVVPIDVDPGFVSVHRLNRVEYDNTVRDLLGTDLRPARDFPVDDQGHGFDNNAAALGISPLLLELYDSAAEKLVQDSLRLAPSAILEAESMTAHSGSLHRDWGWRLWDRGPLSASVDVPGTGRYAVTIRAQGIDADGAAELAVRIDDREIGTITLGAERIDHRLEVELEAKEGTLIAVELSNPHYAPRSGALRSAVIDLIRIEGPLTGTRSSILTCTPGPDWRPCATEILERFASRAWRRPVTAEEIDRLLPLVAEAIEAGESFETSIGVAMHGVLLAPQFLFRIELDERVEHTRKLDDYELAARLSYFLWSTMPDQELFDLAEAGVLTDEPILRRQVRRMLADPKARALVDNFAGQWLFIRGLEDVTPDPAVFPEFDEALAASMRTESELFFESLLQSDRPVTDLLTSRISYVDARLAEHYGIDQPLPDGFSEVDLTGTHRRGFLTQASLLAVTSYPSRTSPVQRGKWILKQLMCSEPPPPPPGVEGLVQTATPTGSLRERLEAHRADPVCASCHGVMDPLGFAFENYDAIGHYRTEDSGFPIDPSGTLPDGTTFDGAQDLSEILARRSDLQACAARQMYVYALGRGTERLDSKFLSDVVAEYVDRGGNLSALAEAIVMSPAFRLKRGRP